MAGAHKRPRVFSALKKAKELDLANLKIFSNALGAVKEIKGEDDWTMNQLFQMF